METSFDKEDYFKGRTWKQIQLTKDNFFTYYEYKELFSIYYNAFNNWVEAPLDYTYVLKDQYADKLDDNLSSGVEAEFQIDFYKIPYNIDFANQTYSVTESGQFINSETITRKSSNDYTIIRAYDTVMLPDDGGEAEFAKIQLLDATGTLYFIND